jgi:tetratricopeptide (TPR) repeat protein
MSLDERSVPRRRVRSSSRPVSPPEVPFGGPLRELKRLLYQLYAEAGSPAYETVASWTQGRSSPLGKSAVGSYLTAPELPAQQSALITLAAVLAAEGPRDVADVCNQVRRLWLVAHEWKPLGTPIEELDNPFTLEVHRAIDAGPGHVGLSELPPYLECDHDGELRKRVREAVEGRSVMVVLVGGSSTGKTRACWEAIQQLPEGWRLWHPFDPTPSEAALNTLNQVGPRTVVWFNETQRYLLTEGSDQGERVAAALRALLTDKDRGPALVLGTMWPEYWETLTRHPTEEKPNSHEQARELLAGTLIAVSSCFTEAVIKSLKTSPGSDPRLAEAAAQARDGELAQYLAGAPALLERHETAPPAAKALVEAAIDIRRLGYGLALPYSLLQAAAAGYLTDKEWDALNEDWMKRALAYTMELCRGSQAPLTRIRPRPDQPVPAQPHYRLADYLEQTGRHRRHREVIPLQLWQALVNHTQDSADAARIRHAAANRLLYCHAIPLLRMAAADDSNAAIRCAELLVCRGDVEEAIAVLRKCADSGHGVARRLAELLSERGDLKEAIAILRERADTGDEDAGVELVDLLVKQGDVEGLWERAKSGDEEAAFLHVKLMVDRSEMQQLQEWADKGYWYALSCLTWWLQPEEAIAVLRKHANAGNWWAACCLAHELARVGEIEEAITVLRRYADAAGPDSWASVRNNLPGASYFEFVLAGLLHKHGDAESLRMELLRGNKSAAEYLITVVTKQSADSGQRLRECGLNADGTIPWD